MLAYAVRRLPYALRSCMAALQQVHVSLEEAAESLGATKLRTIRRVVVPLMAGGILAGFVTSFITAAVELSATILLTSAESQAPMSYGIYLYMQSVAGRGPGAALGVLAVVVVAVGTYLSHRVIEKHARARARPCRMKEPGACMGTKSPSKPPHQPELRQHRGAEGRQPGHRAGRVLRPAGPSGSGKSTLLRLIAGFNQHQRGELLIDGKDITGTPPHLRATSAWCSRTTRCGRT
jgi:hypothetical protein